MERGRQAARRRAAYLAAYDLFEAVQTDRHVSAAAALAPAMEIAERAAWPEVQFVLAAAGVVHSLTRSADASATVARADSLVSRADRLGAPALTAIALGLRAIASSVAGDSAELMVAAGRAVALLDDESQPALDRCTGYVVAAGAFNTLRLWELVDELYTRAVELEPQCEAPAQAAALAVNRVITGLEWALNLLELGMEDEAQLRLKEAAAAATAGVACDSLPTLWRRDIEALALIVRLLRGEPLGTMREQLSQRRADLLAGDDLEALPLIDAAYALALWRAGDAEAASVAIDEVSLSSSSGARSFPLWVRAQVLAGGQPSSAVRALHEHTAMVSRLQWESRQAVLAAARAQIAAERRKGEHDRLSRAVNTDSLTGLANRRAFDEWLDGSIPRLPTALMLVDLDEFKPINDTFGHEVGDHVLRRFGELLSACVRPGDLAVRHGGDEFAVVLQGEQLTEDTARRRAQHLRAAVANEPWSAISPGLRVTASLGLAVAIPGKSRVGDVANVDPTDLYRAADKALYTAKRTGAGLRVARILGGDAAGLDESGSSAPVLAIG